MQFNCVAVLAALACVVLHVGAAAGHSSSSPAAGILVVGSVNADVIVPLLKMPVVGETVVAKDTESTGQTIAGGKGANTAVTCARLGIPTKFACQFGSDSNAAMLERTLLDNAVDISLCQTVQGKPSGMGLVLLCQEGGSTCIVCSGSNGAWDADRVAALAAYLSDPSNPSDAPDAPSERPARAPKPTCLMLQMEVPQHVNEALAQAARAAGIPVFQDLGGDDRPVSPAHLCACTYLSPNLTELKRLVGPALPCGTRDEVLAACRHLQALGARSVLVTMGAEGSLLLTETGEVLHQAAVKAGEVVDETGAGDNFRAAFCAAHFAEGRQAKEAMLMGACAAAVSVSRMGAIPACCRRDECDALVQRCKVLDLSGGSTEGIGSSLGRSNNISSSSSSSSGGSGSASAESDAATAPFPLKFASRLNSMKVCPYALI